MKRTSAEQLRLQEQAASGEGWKKWGPYLSERQWGTVREDYSPNGDAWDYFPHDQARSRAYRWGEDGIAGFSDHQQRLCVCLGLWNGRDPILKERLFGLTNSEGNHGEDVKELYYYLDATPSHSYLKMLYKYPQSEFPYTQLLAENRRRGRDQPEYELIDTGIFSEGRYFDVCVEYAQAAPDDILIRITAQNHGPELAELHLIPQIWFRNTWSWSAGHVPPVLRQHSPNVLEANHSALGHYFVHADGQHREILFCNNESNPTRLWGSHAKNGYWKDGLNQRVVHGLTEAVDPARQGTKAGFWYAFQLGASNCKVIRLRLSRDPLSSLDGFDALFRQRLDEADEFYEHLQTGITSDDARRVQRQAYGGLIWSKQTFHLDVPRWLTGDPAEPQPPSERHSGRNSDWLHLNNSDVISMPDKWEYPWFASWDLAFHCVALAHIDPQFAKEQLILLTREWYMHPSGQIPAYEWAFGDANPPVHAWSAWRVFQIDRKQRGDSGDLPFLERILHKLMLNFTWWVNRKDAGGRNVFQGGFLGLDNIGVFDRSGVLPGGGRIDQADGTSWMAMFALNLMRIALELAQHNDVYEDIATKFFEHFLHIAQAMTRIGGGVGLWDDQDGFFYDVLKTPDGAMRSLKVRSMVGLIPLFAVETLEPELLAKVPQFQRRLNWFLRYRPDLAALISHWEVEGHGQRRLLSLLRGHRMKLLLKRMLDETEFLSRFGVRALSKFHDQHPFELVLNGTALSVQYEAAESKSGLFGGNSNWRGPVWFPVNFLIIESLQNFHHYYGDDFKVECPTGSGNHLSLAEVANELAQRLTRIFLLDECGSRPVYGNQPMMQTHRHFRDHILFYEYFHGDSGRGVGASHQTGWTGLVAKLLMPRYSDHES